MQTPSYPMFNKFLGENAIAQTTGDKTNTGAPVELPQNSTNLLPELLGAGVGGAVLITAILKLFEKYSSNFIDGQQKKLNLEIESKKIELELKKEVQLFDRKEIESKDALIQTVLNTALSSLTENARESREVYYRLLEKYEASNKLHQDVFAAIGDRINSQDKRLQSIEEIIKDILKVLQMRERNSN